MILDETEKFLSQIRNEKQLKLLRKQKRKELFNKYFKLFTKYSLIGIGLFIIFMPELAGQIIGTWITNFIGSIYKNINIK